MSYLIIQSGILELYASASGSLTSKTRTNKTTTKPGV